MAASFSLDILLPILFLGTFSSSLAFVLFTVAVKKLGIARANIYTNLIPVFTAFFSILLLSDIPDFRQWAGMMIVISGVIISQTRKKTVAI
jgi:drug/metabolite transporter (DMT)-like permease